MAWHASENREPFTIHIFYDHVHSKILAVRFVSYLVSNTIQGLKRRWGEVTSHPRKLKPTTISGGHDSDLPK